MPTYSQFRMYAIYSATAAPLLTSLFLICVPARAGGEYIPTRADDARADCMGPVMTQWEGSNSYRAQCDARVVAIRKQIDQEKRPCDAIADIWLAETIGVISCVVHDAPNDLTGNRVVRYETQNGALKAVTEFVWDFDRKQVLGY
jgi:hypothetical protein